MIAQLRWAIFFWCCFFTTVLYFGLLCMSCLTKRLSVLYCLYGDVMPGLKGSFMKKVVCAVRDVAAETYGQPFFVNAVGAALRSFKDEVNRKADDNMLYQHPEHFSLHQLGTFDDETGILEQSGPRLLIQAGDCFNFDKE